MADINELAKYLTDFEYYGDRWRYEFPNGREVSVVPDPRRPFRFELRMDATEPAPGLTTEQVEAKLAEVYALPVEPEPTVALVTVNEMGELTPESQVTVGEWTWPIPERTEGAGVYAPARLAAALAQRGYRRVVGSEGAMAMDGDGRYRVPVERIEKEEG